MPNNIKQRMRKAKNSVFNCLGRYNKVNGENPLLARRLDNAGARVDLLRNGDKRRRILVKHGVLKYEFTKLQMMKVRFKNKQRIIDVVSVLSLGLILNK